MTLIEAIKIFSSLIIALSKIITTTTMFLLCLATKNVYNFYNYYSHKSIDNLFINTEEAEELVKNCSRTIITDIIMQQLSHYCCRVAIFQIAKSSGDVNLLSILLIYQKITLLQRKYSKNYRGMYCTINTTILLLKLRLKRTKRN